MLTDRRPSLLDLFARDSFDDPYPHYRLLRDEHPWLWDEPLRSWVVTRYDDIVALSRDPRLSEDRVTPFYERLSPTKRAVLGPLAGLLGDMMLFNDPPRHTELRGMAKASFTRAATRELRATVEVNTARLLDRLLPAGAMDVVTDLAQPLTQSVIADLLGIPPGERGLLDGWNSLLHEYFTQSSRENDRLRRLRDVFNALVADAARGAGGAGAGGLLSHMVGVDGPPQGRAADVMFANFVLIIDAGQVTTTHLIPNAVRALLAAPDQWRLLRERPDVLRDGVHELLRYDSAVQFTSRIATDAIRLGDAVVEAGSPVTLVVASGNRDERRFADPDRLDLVRDARGHLSFGHGVHYCLGAALGLLETEVVVRALVERTPALRLVDAPLRWHDSINFRFLRTLPVTFEPVR